MNGDMDAKKGEENAIAGITPRKKEGGEESKLRGFGSFHGEEMFYRADKIDLRRLDIQLEKKLSKVWMEDNSASQKKPKEEWGIDLSKLDIRYVLAQGTYGTVFRGTYDGQDVAGT